MEWDDIGVGSPDGFVQPQCFERADVGLHASCDPYHSQHDGAHHAHRHSLPGCMHSGFADGTMPQRLSRSVSCGLHPGDHGAQLPCDMLGVFPGGTHAPDTQLAGQHGLHSFELKQEDVDEPVEFASHDGPATSAPLPTSDVGYTDSDQSKPLASGVPYNLRSSRSAKAPMTDILKSDSFGVTDDDIEAAFVPVQRPFRNKPRRSTANLYGGPPTRTNALDTSQLDPRKARRILANRQSALRSRLKRLRIIAELERRLVPLQLKIKDLNAEKAHCEEKRMQLTTTMFAFRERLSKLHDAVSYEEQLQAALKSEICRLRALREAEARSSNHSGVLAVSGPEQVTVKVLAGTEALEDVSSRDSLLARDQNADLWRCDVL